MTRSLSLRIVLLSVIALLTALGGTASAADRAFTARFSTTDTGQITGIANSLMTCPAAASGCTAARAAAPSTVSNGALDNNAYAMTYVDVDGDSSTFDSSTATLALPSGSSILWAGLYWAGDYSGTNANAAPNVGAIGQAKFKAPGATSYTTLTATQVDESSTNAGRYQAFRDVTALVAAAGNGVYTVADVQAGKGADHYAGWSLIIAYKNAAEPARNMTVFDGLKTISTTAGPTDIPVSGFLTPPSGTIKTDVGFVTYEGDNGIVGDSAALNGTVLSDAQHPATNFFDSHISTDGVLFGAKNPNDANQQGYEMSFVNADGILAPSSTSATIRVTTAGDQYLPGVITFATEIYAPKLTQTKTVTDDNGGLVEEGDTLTYTITGTNSGSDGTAGFVLRDPIPANVDYVPGSLKVAPTSTTPATVTDAADTDTGEYVASSNQIVARLGTGATGTAGGNVKPGASYAVSFQVKVHGPATYPVPNNTAVDNTATASYSTQTTGTPLTTASSASTTIKAPDLQLTKTRTGPAPVAGQATQYTLAIANVGGAKTQGTVTVSDPLPAGVTATAITAPGWTCTTPPATSITCTRSDALAAGSSYPSIVLDVALGSGVTGTLANTGQVGGGGDGNLSNNTSKDTSPSTQSADLQLTKTASASTITIGDSVVFTLTAKNNGPSDATSVAISDPLPSGLTYVSSTPGCVIDPPSGVVTCTIGSLAAGASQSVTITAKAKSGAGATTQTNTATVAGAQSDPASGNNSSTAAVAVSGADLAVTKTSSTPEPVRDGNTITYTVAVKNNGGSAATGVVLTDTLPAALTNVTTNKPGSECVVSSGSVVCTVPGTLAAGATYSVVITATASKPTATIVNRASAMGNEPDPDLSNNAAQLSKNFAPTADLSIAKSASAAGAGTGDTLTFTLATTNNGPDAATNAVATDVLPAGLSFVSAAAGCTYDSATRKVTCALGTLASGATVTKTITTTVLTSAPAGTLTNTANASSDVYDGNPSNDSSQAAVVIRKSADVAVTKTASQSSASTGDTLTFTLTAKDNGPDDATGVTLTDVLPAGVAYVSASAPDCTYASGTRTVTCAIGALANGATATRTITTTVLASASGTIANTVTGSATTPDPTTTNDSATSSTTVVKKADVAITKTAPAGPLSGGDTLAYTLTARNAGPDAATSVVVTDQLPTGVTYVSAPGCSYAAATRTVTCTIASLASGGSQAFTVTTTVAADAPSSIANTASITAAENDPNPFDNSSTATTSTSRRADVALTKTAPAGPLTTGAALRYTLTATNNGPDSAAVVAISDTLPAGVSYTASSAGCSYDGGTKTVSCAAGTLAPGASASFTIDTTVLTTAPSTITNTASVVSSTADPTPGNNTASASTTTAKRADLALVKSAPAGPLGTGDTLAYTLKATNNGPDDAAGVAIADVLPAGVDFASADAGCTYAAATRTVTCAIGGLANGATATRTVTTTVNGAAGASIANTATVSATTTDPAAGNNSSTATTSTVKRADLRLRKTATAGPLGAGDTVTYTLTATNDGPDTAQSVVLTDVLPTGVTYAASDAGCTYAAATRTVTCTAASLASGASLARQITATVNADAPATIANTATVGSATSDPSSANNSSTASTTTARRADLAIDKTAPAGPLSPGDALAYTLKVTNNGPDTASAVVVTDRLPDGIAFGSAAGCSYDAATRTVTCTAASLAPGASTTFTVNTTIGASAAGIVTNTASVASGTTDPVPANNSDDASTTVASDADVAVTKTADDTTPAPGQTVVYTLKATNNGPARATGVTLSDTLPAGVTYVSSDAGCAISGRTVTCDAGDLANGASRAFDVRVTVDPVRTDFDAGATHLITTSKVEAQIDLDPGQTRTVSVTCPAGAAMTDGSFRIDAVDQGTGTRADVHVVANEQVGDDTWSTTIRNDATGRAQAKVFGVCIQPEAHAIVLSAPVTATQVLAAGTHTVALACGPGAHAIAPSYRFDGGDARVRRSEDDGTGWSFTVDVPVSTTATFSVRCMDDQLSALNGHTHDLRLSHPVVTQTIPAGQTVEVQVTCADDAKGIVATMDLAAGLINLGNDPRPKTRAYVISNPTSGPLDATLDLLCLGDRTGGEVGAGTRIDNTATVSATSPDAHPADNTSTVRIDVQGQAVTPAPTPAPAPAPAPAPDPAPATAPRPTDQPATATDPQTSGTSSATAPATSTDLEPAQIAIPTKSATLTPSALAVTVACPTAALCRGTATVVSVRSVKVAGRLVKKGAKLGTARFALKVRRGTVRVTLSRALVKALRAKGQRQVVVRLAVAGHVTKATVVKLK